MPGPTFHEGRTAPAKSPVYLPLSNYLLFYHLEWTPGQALPGIEIKFLCKILRFFPSVPPWRSRTLGKNEGIGPVCVKIQTRNRILLPGQRKRKHTKYPFRPRSLAKGGASCRKGCLEDSALRPPVSRLGAAQPPAAVKARLFGPVTPTPRCARPDGRFAG